MNHTFEEAGLGVAPFRFVGFEDVTKQCNKNGNLESDFNGVTFETKAGGTCDYCGQGIKIFCWVKDANGKMFKVGSSCINKAGDKNVIDCTKRALAKRNKKIRDVKAKLRIENCKVALDDEMICCILKKLQHPKKFMADKGKNLLDWAEWMMKNAGTKGRLEVCKTVEKLISN